MEFRSTPPPPSYEGSRLPDWLLAAAAHQYPNPSAQLDVMISGHHTHDIPPPSLYELTRPSGGYPMTQSVLHYAPPPTTVSPPPAQRSHLFPAEAALAYPQPVPLGYHPFSQQRPLPLVEQPPPSYDDPNLSPVSPTAPGVFHQQLETMYRSSTAAAAPVVPAAPAVVPPPMGWLRSMPQQSTQGNGVGDVALPVTSGWSSPKFSYCSTRRQEEFNERYDMLYPFQQEVFCRAMQQSSIIFLPTGAGKTVIAAALSSYKIATQPGKKIVFIVNRIPLVSQQANVLSRFGLRVAQVCGDKKDATSWSTFMEDGFDAMVVIDAILIEFIAKHTTALFDDCSLLVFDEVHHARKSSNYAKLLQMMDRTMRPMVIGLSASPSARENAAKTREALEELMGISRCHVVCVLKETEDLQQRVSVPQTDVILYQPSSIEKTMDDLIKSTLRAFEDVFVEGLKKLMPSAVYPFSGCRGFPFGSPQYIDKTRQASLVFVQDGMLACAAVADHVGALNQALILLEETSPNEAARFLLCHPTAASLFPNTFESLVSRVEERLPGSPDAVQMEIHIYHLAHQCAAPLYTGLDHVLPLLRDPKRECDTSSKMKVLLELLEGIVDDAVKQDELSSFRGIVFCETKAATVQIVERLMNTTDRLGKLLRPAYFVGHGRTLVPHLGGQTIGMSDNQQQRTLRSFREGDIKLLIATSVAEEGLDIPTCNVVIRYEGVFSVQSFIQSRGRARKRNSQFLVISKDSPANPLRDVLRDCRIQSTVVREVALADQNAIIATNETKSDGPLRIFEADPLKFLMQVQHDYGIRVDQEERACKGGVETSITVTLPDGSKLQGVGIGNPQRSAQEARIQTVKLLYVRGYIRDDTVVSSQSLASSREMPKYRYFKNPNVAVSNTRGVVQQQQTMSGTSTQEGAMMTHQQQAVTDYDEDHWGTYVKPLLLLDKQLRERGFEPPRVVSLATSDTDEPGTLTAAVEFQMRAPGGTEIKWHYLSHKATTWEAAVQGAAMQALRALGHNVVMRPHSNAA